MKAFTDLEVAKSFHGHLGPNLIIGIKMGNRAVAELSPETCFQLTADVYCPEMPPSSCVIDGIQLSTGCTMGKRNIRHTATPGEIRAVFTNTAAGRSVALKVRDDFVEQAARWLKEFGDEKASRMCWEADDSEVFATCSA